MPKLHLDSVPDSTAKLTALPRPCRIKWDRFTAAEGRDGTGKRERMGQEGNGLGGEEGTGWERERGNGRQKELTGEMGVESYAPLCEIPESVSGICMFSLIHISIARWTNAINRTQ